MSRGDRRADSAHRRYGEEIEFDLQREFGLDLLDFFRHKHPWPKLYRLLYRLPEHTHYKAARAMDFELAEYLLDQDSSAGGDAPAPLMTPLGMSREVYLQMATVEAIQGLDYTLRRVHGNKGSPPLPLERPRTALELLERERDTKSVDRVLAKLGLNN
ncbi:hypothetical protein N806_19880 [Rhodococcus sp. P27]|nr:hypothetical protein N806_19880 [Rhodococcus sp. P27]